MAPRVGSLREERHLVRPVRRAAQEPGVLVVLQDLGPLRVVGRRAVVGLVAEVGGDADLLLGGKARALVVALRQGLDPVERTF